MAGSVNKVTLIGNVGRDPEIRNLQNGTRLANLSIATSDRWKDKATGEQREKTEWHRVVIFNDQLVGVIERFVKKGSKLYLEGQLETRKWTDDAGKDNYSTEVVLRPYRGEITLLDSRGAEGGAPSAGYDGAPAAMPNYGAPTGGSMAHDLDDEIPF